MFQPQRGAKRGYHAAVENRKPNPALDDDNDAQAQHSDPAVITELARLQLDTDWETILREANWIGLTTCIEQRTGAICNHDLVTGAQFATARMAALIDPHGQNQENQPLRGARHYGSSLASLPHIRRSPMSSAPAVLVVEDDRNLTRVYSTVLEAEGYHTIEAGTGQCAIAEIRTRNPDLVLLDLGLPDIDGLSLLQSIRANSIVPIIVVSGHGRDLDKVKALDAGADDHLTKPFSVPELLARIRATLRTHAREQGGAATTVSFGDYVLDLVTRRLSRGKSEVHLTQTESKLLATLARHHDRLVTTKDLLKETWGTAYQGKQGYIRVYVHSLRCKLEPDPDNPQFLLNEAGLGYRLNTSAAVDAFAA